MIEKGDKFSIVPAGSVTNALAQAKNMRAIISKIRSKAPAVSPQSALAVSSPNALAPYGNTFCDEITGMEFVWIPGGSFEMGDVLGDDEYSDELLVHRVTLKGFYLGKYAVTQREWQKIMGKNPSHFQKGERYPVEFVSWKDVQDFIRQLNEKSGKNYSLPSEAQWEYAARECGKHIRFGTGKNTISTDEANFDGSEKYKESYSQVGEYRECTVPVDSFSPNSLGLYNMSGNVWEWCQDVWHDDYKGAPTDGSAWESGGKGWLRVVRGGCWDSDPVGLRASDRGWDAALICGIGLGFRLILPVQQ